MSRKANPKRGLKAELLYYSPLIVGVVFMLCLILKYAVNAPFWDEWEMIPLLEKAQHHTLGFADLWKTHNEHRIFFPWLVLLTSAYVTAWNVAAVTMLNLALATITIFLLLKLLKSSIETNWLRYIAVITATVIFFSPVQWQNWLWGGQVMWFMTNLGIILVIILLKMMSESNNNRFKKAYLLLAALISFIITFSLASGMVAWLMGVLILILAREKLKMILLWLASAAFSLALYYTNYTQTPTPSGSATAYFVHHPVEFFKFFLSIMGGVAGSFTGGGLQQAIPGSLQLVIIIGLIVLAPLPLLAYALWIRRESLGKFIPWVALTFYGLMCALSTSFGRLGYGLDLVFKSRYTAFTLMYLIGVSVLIFMLVDESKELSKKLKIALTYLFVATMLPILISSYVVGIYNFQKHSATLRHIKICTSAQYPTDECLASTYPNPDKVRPRLEYAKSRGLAGY